MDEWIKKLWDTHTHTHTQWNIIQPWEKEGNPAICDNMDGPWRHCAKWKKSDRERQIPYDLTYMWNLKTKQAGKQTNETKHTHTENRWVVARFEDGEKMGEISEGMKTYKPPVIK